MARSSQNRNTQAPIKERPKPKLLTKLLFLPFTTALILLRGLIFAAFLSVVVEWVGMTWFWPERPDNAKQMLVTEAKFLGNTFRSSVMAVPPAELIQQSVGYTYHYLFESAPSRSVQQWLYTPATNQASYMGKQLLIKTSDYVSAAGYILCVTVLRATIFVLTISWFFLCGLIGLVDGLIERDIRTQESGAERALVHHFTRAHFGFAFFVASMIYMSMPWSISPGWVLIPAGVMFGMNIYVIAWSFKKILDGF